MRTETTRLFKELLFLGGHVADPRLGAELAQDSASPVPDPSPEDASMNLFKSFWLLGGLQSIDTRIGEDEEPSFGPSYGNRLASERTFGASPDPRVADCGKHARIDAQDQRVAHC